jgi:hypothetical protein
MADKKLSELVTATTANPTDLLYLAQSGVAKRLPFATLCESLSNVTVDGTLKVTSEQTMQFPGMISANTTLTKLVSLGASGSLSIESGYEGQIKLVVVTTYTGSGYFILNSGLSGNTTVLFDKIGESAILLYSSNAWHVIGGTATVTTP